MAGENAPFANRGQVLQAFCALLSATVAVASAYHKLPQEKWILPISSALFVLFIVSLLFGVKTQKTPSARFTIADPYLVIHKDRDSDITQLTTEASIVNIGDESDVLMNIDYVLRQGAKTFEIILIPGIGESHSKGQVLPCELPPRKVFFIRAKTSVGDHVWTSYEKDRTPFTLECTYKFAHAKSLTEFVKYP